MLITDEEQPLEWLTWSMSWRVRRKLFWKDRIKQLNKKQRKKKQSSQEQSNEEDKKSSEG